MIQKMRPKWTVAKPECLSDLLREIAWDWIENGRTIQALSDHAKVDYQALNSFLYQAMGLNMRNLDKLAKGLKVKVKA